ncbi:SLAC1 anion channel family protein [Fictibacillus barbaricus]|uniref:SLAC1 anion channel family protein n=1 Tax=Fictibacillus barbaricus TaxID=182136 RepID=A0ABS2Z8Z0_9BACL|nr:SLAC1 anion channel family protein [Fictibacillus barbaricus]MBN3544141.1 SLAC1 anion channel family protein [Fictibacillus barbaricus]GGB69264.1 transporter [Fictibacillus barbaricus]
MSKRASNVQPIGETLEMKKTSSLQFLPVNLFGSVMGLSGLALAWRWSHEMFGTYSIVGELIGAIAIIVFIILAVSYITKWIKFPHKVREEFNNPIVGNFFGTITIAILLLSSVLAPYHKGLSEIVWIIGTIATIILACIIVHRLLVHKQDIHHATPAWLIPGVGTLDIAVAGGTMPFSWVNEINLFGFAVGGILALVFFTLIFSRLMHHDPLPDKMTPSLMVLIAPFGVGFLSYTNIIKGVDMFASILFYFGLFLAIILFGQVFKKGLPFGASWWAVSFPMAAVVNAAFKYANYVNTWPLKAIAAISLIVLTIVLAVIFVRTLTYLFRGELLKG